MLDGKVEDATSGQVTKLAKGRTLNPVIVGSIPTLPTNDCIWNAGTVCSEQTPRTSQIWAI
jgi:hypothetical protein